MDTLTGFDVVRDLPDTVRASKADPTASPDGLGLIDIRFSGFGSWYRIDSLFEGTFMERVVRGAFAKTIKENMPRVRALFDHGFDPQIGNKVLGPIRQITEEQDYALGVVDLLDTSYNRDLLPGIEAGVYGASMRIRVIKDAWDDEPGRSDHNPEGIPERTIKEVRLSEFGPVTFPANPDTSVTTSARSATDMYYDWCRTSDPALYEAAVRAAHIRTPRVGADPVTPPPAAAAAATLTEPASGHSGLTSAQRREMLLTIRKASR